MKHFLNTHPSFIEDIREAADLIRKHAPEESVQYPTIANALRQYVREFIDFDNRTGYSSPFDDQSNGMYLLEVSARKASWTKWETALHTLAKEYNHKLITYAGINDLCDRLDAEAAKYRNGQKVRRPDWGFYVRYGQAPAIIIGENCYITLTPVNGYYLIDEPRVTDPKTGDYKPEVLKARREEAKNSLQNRK